ncbi:MAG: hypothetical protein IAF94_17315 [Pirellulaceae bacterium]|nr:hypothetical protein [Pirellulaceae bacterium]
MFKTIAIIISSIVFTILGIIAGLVIVLNCPGDLHDNEGFITILMVMLPTAGGLLAGIVVGVMAAVLGGSAMRPN